MDIYTLIAYKPDSVDICRGCLMASYSSDFVQHTSNDVNDIIRELAVVFKANKTLQINEIGYDPITVYKNGIDLNNSGYYDGEWNDAVEKDFQNQYNTIATQAESLANKWIEEENLKKQLEEEKEKAAIASRKAIQERQEFERLRKKFETLDTSNLNPHPQDRNETP